MLYIINSTYTISVLVYGKAYNYAVYIFLTLFENILIFIDTKMFWLTDICNKKEKIILISHKRDVNYYQYQAKVYWQTIIATKINISNRDTILILEINLFS